MTRTITHLELLDEELALRIIEEAKRILAETGIEYLGDRARRLLAENGIEDENGRYKIPASLIDKTLSTTPASFTLFDRLGNTVAVLGDGNDRVNFVPGSSALYYFDALDGKARKPVTMDFVRFTRLTDALDHMYATSTAFVPADVPEALSDSWRLFLALKHSTKPCVTGAFSAQTFSVMARLLEAVRGGRDELAAKPLAIFSVCPSSPLRFTEATSENLIDCARLSIPVELIGMPISGLVAPVTLTGTLVQHTAENLSGLVLSQLARPGAPLLWGGSPAVFDIRWGTTPLGAIESMMLASGYIQIGKQLGLPTQCYMGSSDSKLLDYQCGMESAMGLMMAALSGADSVSGPGMFELENCQSAEKLVIDNEICGELSFLSRSAETMRSLPTMDLFERLLAQKNLIIDEHTTANRQSQRYDPSPVIDRADRKRWERKGALDILTRASKRVDEVLSTHSPVEPGEELERKMNGIMLDEFEKAGITELPEHR